LHKFYFLLELPTKEHVSRVSNGILAPVLWIGVISRKCL